MWRWDESIPVTPETWLGLTKEGRESLINRLFPASGTHSQREMRKSLDVYPEEIDPGSWMPVRDRTGVMSGELADRDRRHASLGGLEQARDPIPPERKRLGRWEGSHARDTYTLSDLDRAELALFNEKNIKTTTETMLGNFEKAFVALGYDPSKELSGKQLEELTKKLNELSRSKK